MLWKESWAITGPTSFVSLLLGFTVLCYLWPKVWKQLLHSPLPENIVSSFLVLSGGRWSPILITQTYSNKSENNLKTTGQSACWVNAPVFWVWKDVGIPAPLACLRVLKPPQAECSSGVLRDVVVIQDGPLWASQLLHLVFIWKREIWTTGGNGAWLGLLRYSMLVSSQTDFPRAIFTLQKCYLMGWLKTYPLLRHNSTVLIPPFRGGWAKPAFWPRSPGMRVLLLA